MLTVSIRSSQASLLTADVHLNLRAFNSVQVVRVTVWNCRGQATPISDRGYWC